jgi:methyl-accepting chemotaxis protein
MAESTPDARELFPDRGDWQRVIRERVRYIPRGESIPDETWRARHRNIVLLLVAHAPFLFALGRFTGTEPYVTGATFTAEPLPVVVAAVCVLLGLAALARWSRFGRRTRTGVASVGLMVSSAQLVYFSGGFIEAHFHFFVMMGVVAVYEDWVPFVVGIVYVAVQHGVFGMFNPEAVYNYPAAVANPWGWALVHALFILGLSTALIQNWISIERSREETRQQIESLEESDEQIESLEAKQAEIEQAKAEAEEAKAEAERRQQEVTQLNDQLLVRADEIADAMAAVSAGDLTAEPPEEDDIEAARAGTDSGGFAVVAEEVKTLADETRDHSAAIERAIDGTVADVERVQTELAATKARIETGRSTMTEAGDAFEGLAVTVDEVDIAVDEVAAATDDGARTTGAVVDAIERVADRSRTVAERSESLADRAESGAATTSPAGPMRTAETYHR